MESMCSPLQFMFLLLLCACLKLALHTAARLQLHGRGRQQDKSVANTHFYLIMESGIPQRSHPIGIMSQPSQDCLHFLGCFSVRGPEHSELCSNYGCNNLTMLNIIND